MGNVKDDVAGSAASIFSPPRSDAPWWVVPILTFILGVAVTAAVMMPSAATPEYQRGHDDGYQVGYNQLSKKVSEVTLESCQLREQLQRCQGTIE